MLILGNEWMTSLKAWTSKFWSLCERYYISNVITFITNIYHHAVDSVILQHVFLSFSTLETSTRASSDTALILASIISHQLILFNWNICNFLIVDGISHSIWNSFSLLFVVVIINSCISCSISLLITLYFLMFLAYISGFNFVPATLTIVQFCFTFNTFKQCFANVIFFNFNISLYFL